MQYQSWRHPEQMHDEAIEKRTDLKLQKETQVSWQELEDFKLAKENRRKEEIWQTEMKQLDHDNQLTEVKQQAELAAEQRRQQEALALTKLSEEQHLALQLEKQVQQLKMAEAKAESDLQAKAKALELEQKHLQQLQSLGVDLTQYLVAKEQPVSKLIRIDSSTGNPSGTAETLPHLHVHEKTC